MLTQKDQRIIRSRLDNIYKIILSKKDIDYFENEIVQTIKNFNKKNPKKKKNISEKTTLVICYGDSVYSEKNKSIRVFKNSTASQSDISRSLNCRNLFSFSQTKS